MCAPTGDDGPSEERIYGAPARAQRSGSRGERRSSEMNELSPPGGSEGYEACDDEGAASWTHRKPSPHRGEGGPKGRMRGRMRGASPPWAPSSVSLRSTASPWKGEAIMGHAVCAPTAQHRRRTASSASLRSALSPKGECFLRRARRPGAPVSAPAEVVRRHERNGRGGPVWPPLRILPFWAARPKNFSPTPLTNGPHCYIVYVVYIQ